MTIYGWDMSHYDSPGIGTAVYEGISFITHKAGGDADDNELSTWWNAVKTLGPNVLLGAYWVQYPGRPAARADAFLARLDDQCPGWRDRDAFILQVDCEVWGGDASTKPGLSDIRAFCDRLSSVTDGKYRPIVYASAGQYGNSLTGLGYPLWNARYPYSYNEGFKAAYAQAGGDSGLGWSAYSGQVPTVWQYTSAAKIGGQETSDANAFRGTLDQLKAITTPGGDMAMTWQDKPWGAADPATVAIAIQQMHGYAARAAGNSSAILTAVGSLASAIAQLHNVDPDALATSLAGALIEPFGQAIAAALPDDLDHAVRTSVEEAIEAAASRLRLTLAP